VPLSFVKAGFVRVVAINGGRSLREKLYRMGIIEGDVVRVISNAFPGPILLQKGGIRIGIGAGMASKIIVQTLGGDGI